jgi:hypothetical protein
VDGCEAPSSCLPFYLSRESSWSLFKFWSLCLWVGLTSFDSIELSRSFSDTDHRHRKYVRKQEAASGLCAQTPQWDCIWELRQDPLPFVHGAFQSPQALALFAHGVHHVSGEAGALLCSGHTRGRL